MGQLDPRRPITIGLDPAKPFTIGAGPGGRGSGAGPVGQPDHVNPLAGLEPDAEDDNDSGWWRSAKNFAKNFGQTVNPLPMLQILLASPLERGQMVQGMGEAQWAELKKAKRAYDKGDYTEASGRLMAGILPLVGPVAAAAGDQIASGDISGGLGTAAGLVAPLPGARAAMRGVRAVEARLPGMAQRAERAATEGMARTMAPQTGPNKVRFGNAATEVAPGVLRDPDMGAWSREGLRDKINVRFQEAELALDAAHEARMKGRGISGPAVIQQLKDRRQQLVAKPVEGSTLAPKVELPRNQGRLSTEGGVVGSIQSGAAPSTSMRVDGATTVPRAPRPIGKEVVPAPTSARVAMIDQAISEIEQLGDVVDFDALKQIRMAYDGPAKLTYNPSLTQDFNLKMGEKRGAADVTSTLRDILSQQDPSVASANAQYTLARTASEVMEAAEEAARVRPGGRRVAGTVAAGGLVGHYVGGGPMGVAVGAVLAPVLDAAFSSGVTTQIATSRALMRFADAVKARQTAAAQKALNNAARTVGVTIEPGAARGVWETLKMPVGKALKEARDAAAKSSDEGSIPNPLYKGDEAASGAMASAPVRPDGNYAIRIGDDYIPTGFSTYAQALQSFTEAMTRDGNATLPLGTRVEILRSGSNKPVKLYTVGRTKGR